MYSTMHAFFHSTFVLVVLSLGVANSIAAAPPIFRLLPGTQGCWSVSADGSTVIGHTRPGYTQFRWTESSGVQVVGDGSRFYDLSADGDIAVGMNGLRGVRQSATSGPLSDPGFIVEVRGTSTSGDILVGSYSGSFGREAFRWTEVGGRTPLGDLSEGEFFSLAEAVSADGTKVVGLSYSELLQEPYLWTESNGMQSLGAIAGGRFSGWAFDISDNGNVVVGLKNVGPQAEAFAWTEASGRIDLGDISGGKHYSFAHGVSEDGSVIVGSGEDEEGEVAFIWDGIHGMRRLQDALKTDFGIDVGIRLHNALDISADGRVIVGTARNSAGSYQGYIIALPVSIPETSSLLLASIGILLHACLRRAKSVDVLARNRTWSSTFAGSCANPAHPEDAMVES